MTNRAEQSVFWPNLSLDIHRMRHTCMTCTKNTPTQPMMPPVAPPSPCYPFQLIVGDYFSLHGYNYLVLADRFSGWFSVFVCGKGDFDVEILISILRQYFALYGVAEELASDMGPQFGSAKFHRFLEHYGVRRRLSSAYNPHSNSRTELAVKSAKRLLQDNVLPDGRMGDRYIRRIL